MEEKTQAQPNTERTERVQPTISAVMADGTLGEMLYRREEGRTLYCTSKDGEIAYATHLAADGTKLVPYSPRNDLLLNDVVMFPSEPEEYESEEALVAEIRAFVHRYVDVSPLFEQVASYYVLLSWVYDAFDELPYLRLRGDPGSGKTRFLRVVGSVCYKPMFASGASTVSPIFRMIHEIRGTLIVDEADFRFSDETAEVVKILNNGNAKGFPVLRSEAIGKEFRPRAYVVFGPKLVATRGYFQDPALESRCITEEMGTTRLRDDVPLKLPASFGDEGLRLRNKLLLFRFRTYRRAVPPEDLVDRGIEPRLNQVFMPLLAVIRDANAQNEIRDLARRYNRELIAERGTGAEAQVLEIILAMLDSAQPLAVKEIANWFADRHGDEYERKVTPKWIGSIVRRRLQLKTQRGNDGAYVVPVTERAKIDRLFAKYGIEEPEKRPETFEEPPDLLNLNF